MSTKLCQDQVWYLYDNFQRDNGIFYKVRFRNAKGKFHSDADTLTKYNALPQGTRVAITVADIIPGIPMQKSM